MGLIQYYYLRVFWVKACQSHFMRELMLMLMNMPKCIMKGLHLISIKRWGAQCLSEQHAVCHIANPCAGARFVVKANSVPNLLDIALSFVACWGTNGAAAETFYNTKTFVLPLAQGDRGILEQRAPLQ